MRSNIFSHLFLVVLAFRLLRGVTAVHHDLRPSHKGRVIGGEEGDHGGDLLAAPQAADWVQGNESGEHLIVLPHRSA